MAAEEPGGEVVDFIDQKELLRMLPLSRSTLWRLRQSGDFPRPVQLTRGRIGFVRDEVEAWIRNLLREEREARR